MKEKAKQTVSFLLRFGLSAGLLFYLFQKNDITKTIEIAKSADIFYLLIALMCIFVIYGLLLIRWSIVIKTLDVNISMRNVTRWFFIGAFFNFVLPTSSGGDVVKVIGLCKDTKDRAKIVASVVLDRIFGFIAITIVALISYFIACKIANDQFLLNGIIILFVVSWGGLLFLLDERLYSFACNLFNRFAAIKEKLLKLHQAFVLIKGRFYPMFFVIAISSLGQVMLGFAYFFTAKGFHQEVDLIYCIAFAPLICVASTLPSIGGLGFRENATVLLFMKIGLTKPAAVSISLLYLLYIVIIGLVGAFVYVCSVSSRRVQRGQPDSASGTKDY